jgi:hypothetical protein
MARVQATVIGRPYRRAQVGEVIELSRRDADLLQRLKRVSIAGGTYGTRDMRAQEPENVVVIDRRRVDLEALEVVELRELADSLGVKVHHAAGAPKLRQAIIEAQKSR